MKDTLGKEFYESANKAITIKRQQTAVEWLKKEIDPINKTQIEWHEIFDQAKEIEIKNLNDRLDAIYEVILQLHNNEEITGFSKRAYAQCLDVIEQFKNK